MKIGRDKDDEEDLQNEATAIFLRHIEPGIKSFYKSKLKILVSEKNYPNL